MGSPITRSLWRTMGSRTDIGEQRGGRHSAAEMLGRLPNATKGRGAQDLHCDLGLLGTGSDIVKTVYNEGSILGPEQDNAWLRCGRTVGLG